MRSEHTVRWTARNAACLRPRSAAVPNEASADSVVIDGAAAPANHPTLQSSATVAALTVTGAGAELRIDHGCSAWPGWVSAPGGGNRCFRAFSAEIRARSSWPP